MSTDLLNLPEVKAVPNDRPQQCPHCGSPVLQSWSNYRNKCGIGYRKPVRDSQEQEIVVQRYRWTDCRCTLHHYPSGVSVWRDGQEISTVLNQRQVGVVLVLGVEGAWLRAKGAESGVMMVVNLARGEPANDR